MDLKNFKVIDTLEVRISHPAFKEGEAPVFTVAGPAHSATRKAKKVWSDAVTKARGKNIDSDELAATRTATRILGWKNVTWDGESLPWSPENALMLLSEPTLEFIKDQINIALGDDESFFYA